MNDENLVEMEIFRTGNYGPKGSYTKADLDRMAADYRPDLLEAPLTFDHAQTGPAFGWVQRLRRDGDRLWAVLKGVPEAVISLMKSGAYKRRSIELFHALPQTGRPYLRAVSLLGAATPEVKGLRNVCFSTADTACTLEMIGSENLSLPDPSPAATAPFAALTGRLEAMFSDLRSAGFCLPDADARSLLALFSDDAAQEIGSGDAATGETPHPGLDCLERLLKQSLLRAPLGAQSTANAASPPVTTTAAFSDRCDPQSVSLHQSALQIMEVESGLTYRDALLRVCR